MIFPSLFHPLDEGFCEKWTDQHHTRVGQRKNLSPRQHSNPWPPNHLVGALFTKLWELMESKWIKGYASKQTVVLRQWGVLQDNLGQTGLIMWIGHGKEIWKLMFLALALCRFTRNASFQISLRTGQFTLSTQLIKPNYHGEQRHWNEFICNTCAA